MITIKKEETNFEDGELKIKRKILEIPIIDELQQDCYLYNSFDAPSELKRTILEEVANKIDEIILNDAPNHVDKTYLIRKLNNIKIVDYEK
jgi:hypothetical protein